MSAKNVMKSMVRNGLKALAEPGAALGRRWMGAIVSVQTDDSIAAITFDDGPYPENTPAVLRILAKHGALATFFMVGELAQRYPELVREVARSGHAIGNHSWSHLSFPLLTVREQREQIRACQRALAPYGFNLFRPPYCHQTLQSRWSTVRAGYEVIAFNVHVEDWLHRQADWMAERLVARIRPGSIVILHDNLYRSVLPTAQADRKPMLDALDMALERLRNRYRFVTVPELLQRGTALRKYWHQRGPLEMQPSLRLFASEHRLLS